MAILMRNGVAADFDVSKLRQGEIAIAGDRMYYCYSPGQVKILATMDDLPNAQNVQSLSENQDNT